MKNRINWEYIAFLAFMAFIFWVMHGCTPQQRFDRLIRRHPWLVDTTEQRKDSIRVDTIFVPGERADTLLHDFPFFVVRPENPQDSAKELLGPSQPGKDSVLVRNGNAWAKAKWDTKARTLALSGGSLPQKIADPDTVIIYRTKNIIRTVTKDCNQTAWWVWLLIGFGVTCLLCFLAALVMR